MPLNLPDKLPAIDLLKKENIFVMDSSRALSQDIRPMHIACLNLMPLKVSTETDIVRLLSNTPLQLELEFMKLQSHTPRNSPIEHMMQFYVPFDEMKKRKYDALIVTGAPVEHLDYEQVDYWDELCEVFDWAKGNVTSTLFICWSAQAALYYYYGIPKYPLSEKMFGVFEHTVCQPLNPLFRGFDDRFFIPHSRHTEIRRDDLLRVPDINILSESDEAGVAMAMARNGREIFVMGHMEYSPLTLDGEYKRDLAKNLPIRLPVNYYPDDDPSRPPVVRWRAHANLFYHNWLNYFIYQETPYNLSFIV
ncbi:MAG: homoserine O-succinyltransferase [Paludibacteraceae bacterium]|nr:homoserine O-succinyltransferase [Paludibacteraceae bacterium]